MADGATIDPKALLVFFGSHQIQGRAKGESVSHDYDEDGFQKEVGVDGIGYFIKTANKGASVVVTLVPNSISNFVLSSLAKADDLVPGGYLLPLVIKETNGRTIFAMKARIMKQARVAWSDGAVVRAWTFGTTRSEGIVGDIGATPLDPSDGVV